MKEQYIIPTQCKRCGATFDLWYDLLETEEKRGNGEIEEKTGKKFYQSLCWGCKKQILNTLTVKKEKEDSDTLDEFFLELGYE